MEGNRLARQSFGMLKIAKIVSFLSYASGRRKKKKKKNKKKKDEQNLYFNVWVFKLVKG